MNDRKTEIAELRAVSVDKQVILLGSGEEWEGWYPVEEQVVKYLEGLKKYALHKQVEYELTEGTPTKKPHISYIHKIEGQQEDTPKQPFKKAFTKASEWKPNGKSDEVQKQIRRNGSLNTALKFLELNHKPEQKVTLIELYKTAEMIEGYIINGTAKTQEAEKAIQEKDEMPIPEEEVM